MNSARAASSTGLVLAAAAMLLLTFGVRQTTGLFVAPIHLDTGVGIATISLALAIGQFVWGAVQPVFGAIADRHGAEPVLVAGGLLLAAVVAVAIAAYVKSSRPPSRRLEAALAAAPVAATLVGKGKIGWKAGLVGGVILLGLVLGRQLAKGRDGGDEAEK